MFDLVQFKKKFAYISKKINDVKIDHWKDERQYELVKKIGLAMNALANKYILKKEVFATGDNGRLYRIARHPDETPFNKVRIDYRSGVLVIASANSVYLFEYN